MTNIQEERATMTRDRIMRGLANELLASGPHEVSIQAVADRAGVSHRTVYRYFESKDELFQAYGEWVDETVSQGDSAPDSLGGLEEQVIELYRRFDHYEEIMEAFVRIGDTGRKVDVRSERTAAFQDMMEHELPTLRPDYRDALTALVRQIASSQTWSRGRHDYEIDGETLGEVASWALKMIHRAIDDGSLPETWSEET